MSLLVLSDEEKAQRKAHYYQKNKTKWKPYSQTPEKLAKMKAYYQKNKDQLNAKQRAYSQTPERKARRKEHEQKPEVKAQQKVIRQKPEYKAKVKVRQKKYRQTVEYKAKVKAYEQKPENKAKRQAREQRPKNKASRRKTRHLHDGQLRLQVFSYYSKTVSNSDVPVCDCCKYDDVRALAIDHITPISKLSASEKLIPRGGRNLWKYLRLNNYPKGYQILCSNCNQMKRDNDDCPHKFDKDRKYWK